MEPVKIKWQPGAGSRFSRVIPGALTDWFEPIDFPAVDFGRPWIYAVMVASRNRVVAWKPKPGEPHPVAQILGGNPQRPERVADLLLMRYLRCFGDCSVGAETQRDQRGLIQTPEESWEAKAYPNLQDVRDMLYYFREVHGFTRHPKNIRYSPSGRLDLSDPLFSTPGVEVIVVTTRAGAAWLKEAGSDAKGVKLVVEPELDPAGLARAHERLYREHGVSLLDCEGGETVLAALHGAGLLDEVFVTTTDVVVDEAGKEGVKKLPDYAALGAELVAEGKVSPESAWTFQRWRLNKR